MTACLTVASLRWCLHRLATVKLRCLSNGCVSSTSHSRGSRLMLAITIYRVLLTTSLAALQQAYPNIGKTAQLMLQAPQPPSSRINAYNLINELTEIPYCRVLDDYHVIEESSIHEAVAFLLDHMPSQMHLVIATRSDPPLPVARLRARGQLLNYTPMTCVLNLMRSKLS